MDSNLKKWLNSMSPEERAKTVNKLLATAEETKDDRMMQVVRAAAGLPELEVNPNKKKE